MPPELNLVQQAAEQIALFIPKLIIALIILIAFWIAGKVILRVFNRYSSRARLNDDVRDLLKRALNVVITVVGIVTALGTLGIDVTAMVAGLGLTGFALGFALQDIISNFLAGVLLLIHRPFRRGNYIKVGDKEGIVIDMDMRYTHIQREHITILIPNSTLFKEAITITRRPPEETSP